MHLNTEKMDEAPLLLDTFVVARETVTNALCAYL